MLLIQSPRRGPAGWLTAVALAFVTACCLPAAVSLPEVFSDYMVLQRERPVPVWGSASAGELVTVTFRDQTRSATAAANGSWSLRLDPLSAGGPDELRVGGSASPAATVVFKDVLVGEVWLGSGQSNMAITITSDFVKGDAALHAFAKVEHPRLRHMTSGSATRGWLRATPSDIGSCSATMFAAALRIQGELDVPVGVITAAVGLTSSNTWISAEDFLADSACQAKRKAYEARYPELVVSHQQAVETWKTAVATAKAAGTKPPPWPKEPVKPNTRQGQHFDRLIRPLIPFAIRGVVWDQGESGTGEPELDQLTMMRALIGSWRKRWDLGDFPFIYVQKPSGLGLCWDPKDPFYAQAGHEPAALPDEPAQSGIEYIDSMMRIRTIPVVGMVVSRDLSSSLHPAIKSSYGRRAGDVALNLAYGRKLPIYGPDYLGHEIQGSTIRVRFANAETGLVFKPNIHRKVTGLQGFSIAGADRRFRWAQATIDGSTVVVSHPEVPQPVAVRYGYSNDWLNWANLFNREGLPGLTFRSDDW
ncbi:hypothetical protein LBMAG53_25340 [Planctomycetota bacterium]|nr:hypothetical protein LBMAG53_25340 [Planctomycetota bacterium]